MIMLLALPIAAMVALAHHCLQFAPSNVLIRRVRASRPSLSTVAATMAVAAVLIVAVKVVTDAVAAGAPSWLNLVVLVLAWDAIKMWWLTITGFLRRIALAALRSNECNTARPGPSF